MSKYHQNRKLRDSHIEAVERLAKSNDSYNGKELTESLYKCVEGCREWSAAEKERGNFHISAEYSKAADRTQIFISNLDNYDNID